MNLRIFISYGHDENAGLSRQLKRALQKRGHRVWLDESEIKGGHDWEVAIEEGLKATDVVLALLTPHAVRRPGGVCLDELGFARFMGCKIVPLMVEWCQPPLSISRLQWLDLRNWRESEQYQFKFGQLLEVIEQGREIDFEGGQTKLLDGLKPIDFGAEISFFVRNFTGREWLLDCFRQWIADKESSRVFFITALPGVGKTSVASYISHTAPSVVAFHICQYGNQEKSSALRCVQSLAYQLSSQLPEYRDLLLSKNLSEMPRDASTLFDSLITQPLTQISRPMHECVIVIDALDEATVNNRNELADLIAYHFDKTPAWLRLLITSRPEALILSKLSRYLPFELDPNSESNIEDIRTFLQCKLEQMVEEGGVKFVIDTIAAKSEGNFLYVSILLEELKNNRLSLNNVAEFPKGLTSVFTFLFERYFPDLHQYKRHQRPLLELVIAAREPLPQEIAAWLLHWGEYEQNDIFRSLGALFPETHETIRPFHRAVIEWLSNRRHSGAYFVSGKRGEERLADFCQRWQDAPEGAPRDYTLHHGFDHLLEQDRLGNSPQEMKALKLLRREDGAFLQAALKKTGLAWARGQLQRAFAIYFGLRRWPEAAISLIYLRFLYQTASPIGSALLLLVTPPAKIDINHCLQELENFPDESAQRVIALLSVARLHDEGVGQLVAALLAWLRKHHAASMTLSSDGPDSQTLYTVLSVGTIDLAERLSQEPLYSSTQARIEIITTVWWRNPRGPLREVILKLLREAEASAELAPVNALEMIFRKGVKEGDEDIYLLAARLLGGLSHGMSVEALNISKLLAQPRERVIECLASLCRNPRMRKYGSVRAATCALILAGSTGQEQSDLHDLLEEMARVAQVSAHDIRRAFACYGLLIPDPFGLTPAEYNHWLEAHLPLIPRWQMPAAPLPNTSATVSPLDRDFTNMLRQFVSQACTALRWVAAQSDASTQNMSNVRSCLGKISGLVRLEVGLWAMPLLTAKGEESITLDEVDPLRAKTYRDAVRWLAERGWMRAAPHSLSDEEIDRAASLEIVGIIFNDAGVAHQRAIEMAIRSACGAPLPVAENSLEGSLWLKVLEAIAESVDVSWLPAWTTKLDLRHHQLPDRLESYLKRLRKRILKIAGEMGWHPYFLELGLYLNIALGLERMSSRDCDLLLFPAMSQLDPKAVDGYPNAGTWPPHFIMLFRAQKVPTILAEVVGSLELCERGVLWGVCRDMCQEGKDAKWWDSVRAFRDTLRDNVLSNPQPRIISYHKNTRTAESLIEKGLASINLLLDDPPRGADFERLANEVNINSDSAYHRLKRCLQANPRAEILEQAVDKFINVREEFSFWLLRPLVETRLWGLAYRFLGGLYQVRNDENRDLLFGFEAPEYAAPGLKESSTDWRAQLEAALGLGPEEGLIYRVDALAYRLRSGTLLKDEQIQHYREKVRLAPDWQEQVRDIFSHGKADQKQIINTLLTVSILCGIKGPALFAEQLLQEAHGELEAILSPSLLWVGMVIATELVTHERIMQVAQSGHGLAALAAIQDQEAIRLHLQSNAKRKQETLSSNDPLLQWYHECEAFSLEEQHLCLQIYNEMAPRLLIERAENQGHAPRIAHSELMPVEVPSAKLRFSEYTLSKPVVNAVKNGRADVAREWCKAILIEAAYGPDRSRDLECLETLCRCAGAWLSTEEDAALRGEWIKFVKNVSDEFETRSPWNSFFGGVANSLGERLSDEVNQWIVSDEFRAMLALGEELTPVSAIDAAQYYWQMLLSKHEGHLLPLRACDAFLKTDSGGQRRRLDPARQYVSLAFKLARERAELTSRKFLASLMERAIETKCEDVLGEVVDIVAKDRARSYALGRIAIDVFLRQVEDYARNQNRDEAPWGLDDLLRIRGMNRLIAALVDEAESTRKSEIDIGEYDHAWCNPKIRDHLGWLDALLERMFELTGNKELFSWIAAWIPRVRPDRDVGWRVCARIADYVASVRDPPEGFRPLIDFSIASLNKSNGRLRRQVELTLKILKGRYRIDDCLTGLDRRIKDLSEGENIDSILSWVAIELGREFPGAGLANRYLDEMVHSEEKFLASDKIAEDAGISLQKRLENLSIAPQGSKVVERTVKVCLKMLDQLSELDDNLLGTLAPVLSRLAFVSSRLDDRIAYSLSSLLSAEELDKIRLEPEKTLAFVIG
jgi:hypothetical protein